ATHRLRGRDQRRRRVVRGQRGQRRGERVGQPRGGAVSYSFDGTNDYLSGSFTSTYADPVTLACFVKMTTHPVAVDTFVCLGNSASNFNDSYRIETGSADDAWRATSRTTGDSSAEITSL